jgi:hypothetical protein
MGKTMVCSGPPNTSWMGKRATREKKEVGNTWLLTCPRLLIVGMPSPWGFSPAFTLVVGCLGVREAHPHPYLGH